MARPTNAEQAVKAKELDTKQLEFAVWHALPAGVRQPELKEDLLTKLGISRQTAWRWSKSPQIQDATRFIVMQNAGSPDKVRDVLDMLHEETMATRNTKTAELWLKATGVLNQFQHSNKLLEIVDDQLDGFSGFTDDELRAMVEHAQAQEAAAEAIMAAQRLTAGGGV